MARAAISGFTLCEELPCSIGSPYEVSIMNISFRAIPQYILSAAFANWLNGRDGWQASSCRGINGRLLHKPLS
jgi:hypothetical protein